MAEWLVDGTSPEKVRLAIAAVATTLGFVLVAGAVPSVLALVLGLVLLLVGGTALVLASTPLSPDAPPTA